MKLKTIVIISFIVSILSTLIGAVYVLYRNRDASHYWFTCGLVNYGITLLLFFTLKKSDKKEKTA
jgi:hypothetical protein